MNERSIFLAALEIGDPAERAAYLDQACAANSDLRRGVEELLAAHARSGSFMARPAAGGATAAHEPIAERPGTVIGPYKLMEQIGEGGMGLVFVAEQQHPVRRKVALKIIKPGMDSRQVIARFEAERQALALMDHQNIAKVYDAGTTASGRPYFVMELVHGIPITQFCDANQLTPRQRLELFVPVCQAIQHAHQKGIIHRDIKPSNILVTMYDDKPVPKVIDFGVAKAIEQRLSENTIYTQFGTLVGTFEYMSPEQAEMNAFGVDTRSDIYALGVLLYELLTGTTPLERQRLRQAALDELVRLIKEEEPPRPSVRLSSSGNLPKIAAARKMEPARLSKLVRGEIDWIVMKCLEKDRTRRYETANGLARDVQRYLKDEPVEACPPTLGYRLRKVYRKNRAAVGVAAAFVVLLTAAAVMASLLAVQAWRAEQVAVAERDRAEQREAEAEEQRERADRERKRAEQEKKSAQAVRDFLQNDLLQQASLLNQAEARRLTGDDFAVKVNPTVSELLDRAAAQLTPERIEAKFPNLPFVQAEVLKTVGATYLEIGQDNKALDLLTRAVERYRTARGPDDPATLSGRHSMALVHLYLGRWEEGRRQMESVRDDRLRILGPRDRDTFKTQMDLAWLDVMTGKPSAAIAALQALQAAGREYFGPDDFDSLLASGRLGVALLFAGRGAEAVRELEAVRDAAHQRLNFRSDHPLAAQGPWYLAQAYKAAGRAEDARALLVETLANWEKSGDPTNPATWYCRHELAWEYLRLGKKAEALELFQANLAAASPPLDVIAHEALYEAYMQSDRYDDALATIQKAQALVMQQRGPDHRSYQSARIRTRMGLVFFHQGQYDKAEPLLVSGYEEMIENIRQKPRYAPFEPEEVRRKILEMYRAMNKPEEVKRWVEKSLHAQEQNLQELRQASAKDTPKILRVIATLAQTYVDADRKEEAFKLFQETLARLKRNGWPLEEASLQSLSALRLAVRRAGRFDLAAEMSAAIVATLRKLPDPPKERLAHELVALGFELNQTRRPAEAEPHLREAVRIWSKLNPGGAITTQAKKVLANVLLAQQKYAEAEPLLLEVYKEAVGRQDAPAYQKNYPVSTARQLIEVYTALNKPDEVAKWRAERAKYDTPDPRPEGKK